MSVFVVDASVAAKWYLEEDCTEAALRLLEPGRRLHAPDFMLLEVHSALCKRLRRGSMSLSDADDIRAALRRCEIRYVPFGDLLDRAYEIATSTGRSMYDCLYVALAVRLGVQVVTADHPLYDGLAATAYADHVLWVEDVPGPAPQAEGRGKGKRRRRR